MTENNEASAPPTQQAAPKPSQSTAATAAPAQRPYTAFVVFHGMGQQRRYESVWRVVEALDAWVFGRISSRKGTFAETRLLLKTRREQLFDERGPIAGEGLAYVEARYAAAPTANVVRFYEGYWAPATVAGTSAISVIVWLMSQITRPIKVLCAPWRAFGRLRRADLQNLAQRTGRRVPSTETDRSTKEINPAQFLLTLYADFVKRRPPEPGTFKSFLQFVDRSTKSKPLRIEALALARRWHRTHYRILLRGLVLLLVIGLSIVSVCVLVIVGLLELLHTAVASEWLTLLLERVSVKMEMDVSTVLSLVAAVATVTGVTGFLRDVVGDVQQFVTYQETDQLHARRNQIMAEAQKTLRHVLADQVCTRVVVFGHSLGSAVALDTILALRAINECAAPRQSDATHMAGPIKLGKIEHLITCGSPIDKIAFFFATLSSEVRGFELMYDDLRGDIGKVPFSNSGRSPHVHWTNFWDEGDPISGPLETVMPAEQRIQRVDNVRIASVPWPDVAASHDAYFEDPSVVQHLYDVAFLGKWSFVSPRRTAPDPGHRMGRPIFDWVGPGQGWLLQSILLRLVPAFLIALVWTTVGVVVPGIPAPAVWHLGVFAAVLLSGGVLQRSIRARVLGQRGRRLASKASEAVVSPPIVPVPEKPQVEV